MTDRSLVVTGSTGQLGRALVAQARVEGWTVTGLARGEVEPCDLTDRAQVAVRMARAAPSLVIHAAALTDVDHCELHPDDAERANVIASGHVADAALEAGAHLVLVSTDHVFDGTKETAYLETDDPRPASTYGRTKLAAEQLAGATATVARTSWLCGRHGANVVKTLLRLAGRSGPIRFVDDQRGCPTIAEDLAPLLLRLGRDRAAGIIHTTNQGPVTWFEFAREVIRLAGHDPHRVEAITTAELVPARPAPRPANSVLAPEALRTAGIELLPDHRMSLRALVADLAAQA